MRDSLARLEREGERLRHLRRPFAQHVLLWQSIEGVVDLHRIEFAGVVAEHCVVFQILRIERALPLLERVAARPSENLHDALRFDSPFFGFSDFSDFSDFSRARLAFSASIRSSILVSVLGVISAVMSCPSTLR